MLVDSHCHLHFLDLAEFDNDLQNVLDKAQEAGVEHMLAVCTELKDYPHLKEIADRYPNISISVGIHPDTQTSEVISSEQISKLTNHPKCIAIGETGLDYYRTHTEEARESQRLGFRHHIRASIDSKKPLIIHTRQAAEDTLAIMAEEKAEASGGVMHCFTESLDIAQRAIEMNFYISFSGIVTFKNAKNLQEVAQKIPLERILIETDAPYLAPVPFRGKQNHPALVRHVAMALSELRQESFEQIAEMTRGNFYRCFRV